MALSVLTRVDVTYKDHFLIRIVLLLTVVLIFGSIAIRDVLSIKAVLVVGNIRVVMLVFDLEVVLFSNRVNCIKSVLVLVLTLVFNSDVVLVFSIRAKFINHVLVFNSE